MGMEMEVCVCVWRRGGGGVYMTLYQAELIDCVCML